MCWLTILGPPEYWWLMRVSKFCIFLTILVGSSTVRAEETGFVSIFDGKSLQGWKCIQEGLFQVQEGAIVATNTESNPIKDNRFLIWQGGKPGDFELQLKFKIEGPPNANSGIQFRGSTKEDGHVVGYQADIDRAGKWLGTLYDEHTGRKALAVRGQKTEIEKEGKRTSSMFGDPEKLKAKVDLSGWNEYHISAKGNHIILRINGEKMSEVIDREEGEFDPSGIIALQIHKGPPMTIRFKDIQIKQ